MSLEVIEKRKFHEEAKSKYNNEDKMLKRELWLSELGLKEGDVMMDYENNGKEYVMVQSETEFGEEYKVYFEKVDLPTKLQTYYVDF